MRKQKTIAAVALSAAIAGGALFGATLGNPLASGAQDGTATTTTAPSGSSQAPDPGPGGEGRHRGPFDLEVAAKTLGLSTDELRTQLEAGKSLADIAKAQNVDKQKVIDALVNEVKTRSAQAVKDGKITQAQADEHVKNATERITKMVDEGFPKGGPRGDHPEPPADDDGDARAAPDDGLGARRQLARDGVARLYAALDQLTPAARLAFTLHELDGRSLAETAALVGSSVTATKLRVWRARKRIEAAAAADPVLREFLEPAGADVIRLDPGGAP